MRSQYLLESPATERVVIHDSFIATVFTRHTHLLHALLLEGPALVLRSRPWALDGLVFRWANDSQAR